jgi:rhodanese-related sulfurtransferase
MLRGSAVDIKAIDRDELKAKLDRADDFKLVLTLHDWAYRVLHIPGSIHFHSVEDALEGLSIDEEIVVYCSNVDCVASQFVYRGLVEKGPSNVRRYSGALGDWESAGLPLEGESARQTHTYPGAGFRACSAPIYRG